jgi:hypothetical protein
MEGPGVEIEAERVEADRTGDAIVDLRNWAMLQRAFMGAT